MPLERFGARKEVPTVVAEGNLQRVLLPGVAMSLEVSHIFSVLLQQSRHLISRIESRA
jgi:hypothetical protein